MEQPCLPRSTGKAEQYAAARASRRKFIRYAGLSGIAAAALASCTKITSKPTTTTNAPANPVSLGNSTVSLGTGDTGILNFAYAIEQLQAAFYIQVVENPYENIASLDLYRITDIRDHEIAHREFFKNLLGSRAIPALTPNFTSINFGLKPSVLTQAHVFEDLAVTAYNGVAALISQSEWLTIIAKIVSVEARHSAYIWDAIGWGTFANAALVDDRGLEREITPAQALTIMQPFFIETLDGSGL